MKTRILRKWLLTILYAPLKTLRQQIPTEQILWQVRAVDPVLVKGPVSLFLRWARYLWTLNPQVTFNLRSTNVNALAGIRNLAYPKQFDVTSITNDSHSSIKTMITSSTVPNLPLRSPLLHLHPYHNHQPASPLLPMTIYFSLHGRLPHQTIS